MTTSTANETDPIAKGNWAISRDYKKDKADATAGKDVTIQQLAEQVGLVPKQFQKWLSFQPDMNTIKLANDTTKTLSQLQLNDVIQQGQVVQIPNQVYVVWFGDQGQAGKIFVKWTENLKYLGRLGFKTVGIDYDALDAMERVVERASWA